jgi:hypothetical protein
MSLSGSPSNASISRDATLAKEERRIRRGWANWLLLPVLVAILKAAAVAPLIHLILGPEFGLTAHHPAPWPGALAIIGLLGFWAALLLFRGDPVPKWARVAMIVLWLLATAFWIELEPGYSLPRITGIQTLVTSHAYVLPLVVCSWLAWYLGMHWAGDAFLFVPDSLREIVRNAWIFLAAMIVLGALVRTGAGHNALVSAKTAVPVAIVCSVGLIASSEILAARETAVRRGGKAPEWGRWLTIAAGIAGVIAILALIIAVILGPDGMKAIIDGILHLGYLIALGIGYALFGIVYVLYWIIYGIYWVLRPLLGNMKMPQPPRAQQQQAQQQQQLQQNQPAALSHEWIMIARWVGLGIGVLIAAFIIWRMTRAKVRVPEDTGADESRESLFSGDLARRQLRDLFRRRGRERVRKLDLTQPPNSVREAYRYLTVLAARQGLGREEAETPHGYATRLTATWSDVHDPVTDLTGRYQRVRYGDLPDDPDRAGAIRDWQRVYERHEQPPEESPPTPGVGSA